MLRKYAAAALVATMLLALAGCGGDPQPKFGPRETSPTSPSTASASSTVRPEDAKDVIRDYVTLALKAQNTGRTEKFRRRFPDCKPCLDQAQAIDQTYRNGGYIDSGSWRVTSIKLAGRVGARYEYDLVANADPGTAVSSKGAQEQHYPGGVTKVRFTLTKRAGEWILQNTLAMS